LNYISGVINQKDKVIFERLIFRATMGTTYINIENIEDDNEFDS